MTEDQRQQTEDQKRLEDGCWESRQTAKNENEAREV